MGDDLHYFQVSCVLPSSIRATLMGQRGSFVGKRERKFGE